MKFQEYDIVRLLKNYENNVKKGDIGAVIMVFTEPNEAYEVEFLDEEGYHKAQCTILPDDLEKVQS
ncbi:DUF4926 domain-containing protein [Listeria monocytogenes]|uniref:DUF4926 domain-containing protein n=1 Tax=Listeria monocytogenes TaxID=1639 RepID=UPI0012771CBE|nr:DUF4926 domain-containing protein [Listeria monocytogenes]EAF0970882.1 DUF4926 domain-containing protein [Listeria monocytogenes]EAG9432839.1 DUF4926 domain-containing protein [Listeria monocytogenes]EAK8406140.1 DUF4926 domain-containing protein [Listeria monocytogenes]EAO7443138.1 DUF4926 domain-containing protein [Listeria monocytogenes]EAV9984800.1 DUF4926 domain-containing protein [Listeria monocytogenes]